MVTRILCAFVPGERERRDDYIAAAGDRVVTSPDRWWRVVDLLGVVLRVGVKGMGWLLGRAGGRHRREG